MVIYCIRVLFICLGSIIGSWLWMCRWCRCGICVRVWVSFFSLWVVSDSGLLLDRIILLMFGFCVMVFIVLC